MILVSCQIGGIRVLFLSCNEVTVVLVAGVFVHLRKDMQDLGRILKIVRTVNIFSNN